MPRESKPWFRKSSNTWVSRVRGKLHTLARGRGNRAEAVRALRDITSRPAGAVNRDDTRIVELVERFLARAGTDLSSKSVRRYRSLLNSFAKFVGLERVTTSVRAVDVLAWVDSRGWNQSTRTLGLAVVSRLFAWGAQVGILERNPLGRIPRPGILRRERCPTEDEILSLITHLSGPLKELCECLKETGARPSELARAKVENVQESRLVLNLHKTAKKTRKPRVIYLTSKAKAIIERRCIGKAPGALIFTTSIGSPWRDKWISEKVGAARAAAKLGAHVVAYSIRHWFITEKLRQGVPAAVVAALVGTSIRQLDRHYGHVGESDELRRWVG